nr:hypothetical protein BHE74_00054844 [Ipomoea batatas]
MSDGEALCMLLSSTGNGTASISGAQNPPSTVLGALASITWARSNDVGDAAINGVFHSCLSFDADGKHGGEALVDRELEQQFRDVASPEHLVDGGENGRTIVGAKIRHEHATGNAPPAEELACATRRTGTTTSHCNLDCKLCLERAYI